MLIHQIARNANPDTIAFLGKHNITYKQLELNIHFYRNFFHAQGVLAGDNVGLFCKNSPEFIYSYLAIASLGAVVVPLNTQLVPREIAYIVSDAKIKTLITMLPLQLDDELANLKYETPVNQLVVPDFSPNIHNLANENITEVITDENSTCTIIYTSGTTGNPKGAMLSHKNLISNAQSFSKLFPVNADDKVLCVLPMFHCFAWTAAVLVPLVNGISIKILENFTIRDTIAAIRDNQLTMVFGIPTMYKLFAQWGTAADFSCVNLFVSGGSALPQEISEQFTKKTSKVVVEGYGLSEASPIVSLNPLDKVKYCSIGQPLPDVSVRIVNENNQDLPPRQIGELLVQGPNVMNGYYNLPTESAKALQNGWLHTGDLAYCDEDGYIFIVDRLKDMIITSGENIYPREIEELLYSHPIVSEVAVIGVPDKLRGTSVHAYIVPNEGHGVDKKVLKSYLQTKLAAYKIPREFIAVPSLPKNSTGKILKKVLRQQAQ